MVFRTTPHTDVHPLKAIVRVCIRRDGARRQANAPTFTYAGSGVKRFGFAPIPAGTVVGTTRQTMEARTTLHTTERTEFEHHADDGGEWISPEGRGDTCRTESCHSQINVRHVLRGDGRIVMLCADCRALYLVGDRR